MKFVGIEENILRQLKPWNNHMQGKTSTTKEYINLPKIYNLNNGWGRWV